MFDGEVLIYEDDAAGPVGAGAGVIVENFGLTTGGSAAANTAVKLAQAPALADPWAKAALAVSPDALVLAHGGPGATPEDAEYDLKNARPCKGSYGASSMERLRAEFALNTQFNTFTQTGRYGPSPQAHLRGNRHDR